ncbi:MAG: hypothetical protein HYY58_02555, partial [Candidatus Omnitrophica bacterium]|nr:hypothetical protein [Candidatus Omnitrophota bacterium]
MKGRSHQASYFHFDSEGIDHQNRRSPASDLSFGKRFFGFVTGRLRRNMAFCFNDGDVKAERAQWNEVMVCGQQSYAMYIRQGSEEEVTDRDGLLGAAQGSPEIAGAKRGFSREVQHGQMREGA